ncbi:MAG TPA: HesA/MoeB/ThiF family protein [Bacteroidia bacterium]|nr:HesA/MoeB/ThiF family protein [Bacteroidia bacterium]
MLSQEDKERYSAQIRLHAFGEETQVKLKSAKVLVVGAGGLGCPVLLYLCAAGVGCIGVVDNDVVELSNLQRQVLYEMRDCGKLKAKAATERLLALNPSLNIIPHAIRFNAGNAWDLLSNYDLVIDASDNFETRFLINDVSALQKKPMVYGAVFRYEGQVCVFNLHLKDKPVFNYRHLVPKPPESGDTLNCNSEGVLGVLPGLIGNLQAAEAIKIICGLGLPLHGQLVNYNVLTNRFYEVALNSSGNISGPRNKTELESYDYTLSCNNQNNLEISVQEFERLRMMKNVLVLDIREENEQPETEELETIRVPLSRFGDFIKAAEVPENLILLCQSGSRSLKLAGELHKQGDKRNIYSLKGGLLEWKRQKQIQ